MHHGGEFWEKVLHWRREWKTTSVFLPWEPHEQSVQLSHSVMSNSLWTHGLQHTRPPCPSPTPGSCSNSCPLSQWCHSTISSSVVPFSSKMSWWNNNYSWDSSCTMSWTSIYRYSGTLSDLIPWIYLSLPLYNHKGFIWFRSYMNGPVVFPTFFSLRLNLAKSSWSEPQSAPGLIFANGTRCHDLSFLNVEF